MPNLKTIEQNKGQFVVFYCLFFSLAMLFMSFSINTGMLVNHKIKLQQTVDLAAHSAASVMSYYMSNTDYNQASIANYNRLIMEKYYDLVNKVTLVQCSRAITDPYPHCADQETALVQTVFCDDNSPQNGRIAGLQAMNSIDYYVDQYNNGVNGVRHYREKALSLAYNMREAAKSVAIDTLKKNLPNVSDEEIYVQVSGIDFSAGDERQTLIASFRRALTLPGTNKCTPGPKLKKNFIIYTDVERRLLFDQSSGSGYTVVGVNQNRHFHDTTTQTHSPSIEYVNWTDTFAKQKSPMFQAFAAAAPMRPLADTITAHDTEYSSIRSQAMTTSYNGTNSPTVRDPFGFAKLYTYFESGLLLVNRNDPSQSFGYDDFHGQWEYDYEDTINHPEVLAFNSPPLQPRLIPLSANQFIRQDGSDMSDHFYGDNNPFSGSLSDAIFGPMMEYARYNQIYQRESSFISGFGESDSETAYVSFRH